MNKLDFLKNYIDDFSKLINENSNQYLDDLLKIAEIFQNVKDDGKKILIFGNGGSSAIASHFSVDITKNAGYRCVNFNEADLITCFSNDYGYEEWVKRAVEFYGDEGDVFIGISSSGSSKNILYGCEAARKAEFSKIITLSGMDADNPLRQLGDINLWVNSKAYNHVENIHQFWLLAVVDTIIGKAEYSANLDEI